MDLQVFKAKDLPEELVEAWGRLQQTQPQFSSPYFRPEYTLAVGGTRSNVEVGVAWEAGRPVGFFPYERQSWNLAAPVGGRISDFQAFVVEPQIQWSPKELLAGCGLRAYAFDHQLAEQVEFREHQAEAYESPYLDLSRGFDEYYTERRQTGSLRIVQFLRKLRKIEREIGPVRLVGNSTDEGMLELLLDWKDRRYRATELANPFRQPKVIEMLRAFLASDNPAFRGNLSGLYAGEDCVAVLFSLVSFGVWHYCFPAYNEQFSRYSPGSMLLTRLAQQSHELGITRIDLGKGKDEYKESFASGSVLVTEGSVDLLPILGSARSAWRTTRNFVKNSALYAPARKPIRWLRETLDWVAYR